MEYYYCIFLPAIFAAQARKRFGGNMNTASHSSLISHHHHTHSSPITMDGDGVATIGGVFGFGIVLIILHHWKLITIDGDAPSISSGMQHLHHSSGIAKGDASPTALQSTRAMPSASVAIAN